MHRRHWVGVAIIERESPPLDRRCHAHGSMITRKIPLAPQRLHEMPKKYLAVIYDCNICIFRSMLSFRDLRFWKTGNRDVLLSVLHRFISRELFNNSLQSRISHGNMHAWRNCEHRPMQRALHSPQGKYRRLLRQARAHRNVTCAAHECATPRNHQHDISSFRKSPRRKT